MASTSTWSVQQLAGADSVRIPHVEISLGAEDCRLVMTSGSCFRSRGRACRQGDADAKKHTPALSVDQRCTRLRTEPSSPVEPTVLLGVASTPTRAAARSTTSCPQIVRNGSSPFVPVLFTGVLPTDPCPTKSGRNGHGHSAIPKYHFVPAGSVADGKEHQHASRERCRRRRTPEQWKRTAQHNIQH